MSSSREGSGGKRRQSQRNPDSIPIKGRGDGDPGRGRRDSGKAGRDRRTGEHFSGKSGRDRRGGEHVRRAHDDRSPRAGGARGTSRHRGEASGKHDVVHLSNDVVRELQATARPGKGDILVKVFGEAAGAYVAGDLDEAVRLGEQAKHLALRAAAVRELLGIAYYDSERWSEAARELAAFRRLTGTTEQNPMLADAYRAMKKPEKAVELTDEIDRRAVEPAVWYEGAIVGAGARADLGRLDEAIARLEALDLRPDVAEAHHLRAWYALADLLERRGRFTQAREYFEAVASADDEMTDAADRAARLRSRG